MPAAEFKYGDRVVHPARPEWGTGVVTAAQPIVEDGNKFQRLTLRFDRAGLKTISTAHADLRPAEAEQPAAALTAQADPGWLSRLEAGNPAELMAVLPEATRDPFTSLGARLKVTFSLYRFTDQGGALLDWAAMQTGLADPLARFNRHELEVFFKRFSIEREAHLKRLLLDARKSPSPEIERAIAEAPPGARDAMRRLHL